MTEETKDDGKVDMELDLPHDVILMIALAAHKKDITLNQMMEIILQEAVTRAEALNATEGVAPTDETQFYGFQATQSMIADILAFFGTTSYRVTYPACIITADYRPERLNIKLDKSGGVITGFDWG